MEYEEENMISLSELNISQLPVQDILWILHAEKTSLEDSEETALTICIQDERGVQLASAVVDSMHSLEFSSIYYLLSQAMLHPFKGKSRKPRCLTCDTADFFQYLKSGHNQLNELCLPIFYGSDVIVPSCSQPLLFYQCSTCHIRATPPYFHTCNQCKSVRYCSQKCQLIDWNGQMAGDPKSSHQEWCLRMQTYQEATNTLADLPFDFIKETISEDFTPKKYMDFLVLHGVYNIGVWRYECPSQESSVWEFGELAEVDFPFVLVEERELGCQTGPKLQQQQQQQQHLQQHLETWEHNADIVNWFSYYKWRSFSLNSPVALLLSYPMTIYYIITSCLRLHYPIFGVELPKQLVIHVIGAEREADMFHYFKELTCLLPSYLLEIHLYGKKVSRKANGWKKLVDNMSFQLHRGHWHSFSGESPHFVIGFNAGLGAYKSWTNTLKRLQAMDLVELLKCRTKKYLVKENIAAYFTEYCQYSHDWSAMALKKLKSGIRLTTPLMNPFRSPVRMFSDEHCMPSYSNAFLSHLEYEDIQGFE